MGTVASKTTRTALSREESVEDREDSENMSQRVFISQMSLLASYRFFVIVVFGLGVVCLFVFIVEDSTNRLYSAKC